MEMTDLKSNEEAERKEALKKEEDEKTERIFNMLVMLPLSVTALASVTYMSLSMIIEMPPVIQGIADMLLKGTMTILFPMAAIVLFIYTVTLVMELSGKGNRKEADGK